MNSKVYVYCILAILYAIFLDFVIGLSQEKVGIHVIVFLLVSILSEVTENKKEGKGE